MTTLCFAPDWIVLEGGPPEAEAAHARLAIHWGSRYLTEARDTLTDSDTSTPVLNATALAEWLVWNWWRLFHEVPRKGSRAADWAFAHQMTTIGDGYLWPHVTLYADGVRCAVIARPTPPESKVPLLYIANVTAILPSGQVEMAIDDFVRSTLERLTCLGHADSNLAALWQDLTAERADPALTQWRRLEARLGQDPGALDAAVLNRLIAQSQRLGATAVDELATEIQDGRKLDRLVGSTLDETARRIGTPWHPQDGIARPEMYQLPSKDTVAAWRYGKSAAQHVRTEAKLGEGPIEDKDLCDLLGISKTVLHQENSDLKIGFALDRIVLSKKQKNRMGRRFELARLLGDHVMNFSRETALRIVGSQSKSYLQQAQRAFAAELLAPFAVVYERLPGDLSKSAPARKRLADEFQVSEWVIMTELINHRRLDPSVLPDGQDAVDDHDTSPIAA